MTEWQSISVLLTNTARHSALSLVAATSLYSQRRLERPALLLVPPRQSLQSFTHLRRRPVPTQPPAAVHGDGLGCDVLAHTDEENSHRALERSTLRNNLIKSTQVLDMCKQEECCWAHVPIRPSGTWEATGMPSGLSSLAVAVCPSPEPCFRFAGVSAMAPCPTTIESIGRRQRRI